MRKTLLAIFSYSALGYVCCLVFSLLSGRLPILLGEDKISYIFLRSLLYFFRILPAIFASAFLVALSKKFSSNSQKAQIRFSPVMMKNFHLVMIVSLIMVAILTLSAEIFNPLVKRKINHLENAPILLAEYKKLGQECLKNENYTLAHRYGTQILKLKSDCVEGKELIDKSEAVLKAIKEQPQNNIIIEENSILAREIQNESVTSLIQKSKAAFENRDFFEAHYYAELASTFGTEKDLNIKEAKILASNSWNEIQKTKKSPKTYDQKLFDLKRKAYSSLSKGDNIEAYYEFLEIARKDEMWSSDPDVTKFLEIAKNRVENQCFFIDETDELKIFETHNDVYFTVKKDSGVTDVVFIQGITPVKDGGRMIQYLRGLSIVSYTKNGTFLKQLSVPYAKMISLSVDSFDEETKALYELKDEFGFIPYILLESIDRNQRDKKIVPTFEFPHYTREDEQKKENFVILAMSTKDFNTALDLSFGAENISLPVLIDSSQKSFDLGFSFEVNESVLIKRIMYPILLMCIFVFMAIFAWNFRIGNEQLFKFKWIVLIPVCTFVLDIFIQITLSVFMLFDFFNIAIFNSAALLVSVFVGILILFVLSVCFVCKKSDE